MANPLQILLGGSSEAHQQREAQISEASAAANKPPAPTPQQAPQAAPQMNGVGQPSFISSAATTAPMQQNTASKTLLGQ